MFCKQLYCRRLPLPRGDVQRRALALVTGLKIREELDKHLRDVCLSPVCRNVQRSVLALLPSLNVRPALYERLDGLELPATRSDMQWGA